MSPLAKLLAALLGLAFAASLVQLYLDDAYFDRGRIVAERDLSQPNGERIEVEDSSGLAEEKLSFDRSPLESFAGPQAATGFVDRLLGESEDAGYLILEYALAEVSVTELEERFIELASRDLEDRRSLRFASRILQEITSRDSEAGLGLLYAMSTAEKEQLAPSLVKGWSSTDAAAAFAWLSGAWSEDGGEFIDRNLQNVLYVEAMEALMLNPNSFGQAVQLLGEVSDPELKQRLTRQVANRLVLDGPENALDRISQTDDAELDRSIMDAVAEEWAARDSVGAMNWTLDNESEVSTTGVKSIAKTFIVNQDQPTLLNFHGELRSPEKKDAVAYEATRLTARRDTVLSAVWATSIIEPTVRDDAVMDALYEQGYDNFSQSMDYIDSVYDSSDPSRETLVYSSLQDWLRVDLEAVVNYLGSGRANLSNDLSEALLGSIEAQVDE